MRVAWLILLIAGGGGLVTQSPHEGAVRVQIDTYPLRPDVRPFGMNLGSRTFWDAGQFTKNLLLRNPGFEALSYRSIVRCGTVDSAGGCLVDGSNDAWPEAFWQDGTFEIITGNAHAVTGTIPAYRAGKPAGARIQLQPAPRGLIAGDWIILRKEFTGDPAAGWWPSLTGGATITSETTDLPPATPGRQAIRLTALQPLAEVRLASMFDTMPGRSFVRLNGTYRLSFWAKGAAGSMLLHTNVGRFLESSARFYLEERIFLDPVWKHYEYNFEMREEPAQVGPVRVLFRVDAAQVLLDDVVLEQVDSDSANLTAFRDPFVQTLADLQPGILRFWADHLGESLNNLIAPPLSRQRAGYSFWLSNREDISYGLHEFLELCRQTGADPWIVVPPVFSLQEASGLIEYLAGSPDTGFGARRAERGQPAPWTTVFRRIHLEFGNESWNGVFRGGGIDESKAYGSRAQSIFAAMRQSPAYDAARFDLVLGGQAVWTGRNREIQTACNNNDSMAIAPYLMFEVNSWNSCEDLFGPLFAEAEWTASHPKGTAVLNRAMLDETPRGAAVNLSVYEFNLHTTGGSIPQEQLDQFTPSLGAGLGVASAMLQMLRDLNIRDQVFYSLPQFDFQRPDGKRARLWGAVVDTEVTGLRRPQFLALQLINRVLAGGATMIVTTLAEPALLWRQPLVNGVQLDAAHLLQTFAFQKAGPPATYSVILLNLDRNSELLVTFSGASPRGRVVLERLEANAITDTNELERKVTTRKETLENFDSEAPFPLPRHSMTVLTWEQDPVTGESQSYDRTNRST